jgi:hypothetical protein
MTIRSAGNLWSAILLMAAFAGCQSLHSYRPVVFLVRDAETHQPITEAEVQVCYPLTRPSVAPHDAKGSTNEQGTARLEVALVDDDVIHAEASARGYMTEGIRLPLEVVRACKPSPLFGNDEKRAINFMLDLYAEPRFQIELVLPNGYRGIVRADVQLQEQLPAAPGQRSYSYQVGPKGDVLVNGPVVLRHVMPRDYRARFADGTPLKTDPASTDVALRPLRAEGQVEYFVVGIESELTDLMPAHTAGDESHGHGGGKGGGRGGGGRHGRGGSSLNSDDNSGS